MLISHAATNYFVILEFNFPHCLGGMAAKAKSIGASSYCGPNRQTANMPKQLKSIEISAAATATNVLITKIVYKLFFVCILIVLFDYKIYAS